MRADRLVATLLLLQARGRVTAAEIAADLEVSLATARRDLEALSAAGIPVYPQAGRGGGWQLLGGARTDLTGLTAPEVHALFLLAGPAARVTPGATSALRKLVRALPATFRADAEAAASAVVVDAQGWGGEGRRRPEALQEVQSAVVRRRRLRFSYDGKAGSAARTVDPWGVVDKDDNWYLIAGTEHGQRTFRVDRMTEVSMTEASAQRPADFDLATAWGHVVDEMERRRSVVTATALADPRVVRVLRDHFGRHFTDDGPAADGRHRVRVSAHLAVSVAEQLAGFADAVEVLEPASVRAELARIGAALSRRYAAGDT